MSRTEKAEFTNLCMITDPQGRILVEDRKDTGWPGVCFPGGHVEPKESFVESVIREVREETGLTIREPRLCGVKQFQKRDGARYVVFFFRADQYTGTLRSSDEGEVFWVTREELPTLKLVDDFMDMVRVFETDSLSEFYYEPDTWNVRLY